MAWNTRNNKLARFFAFKSKETRDTFFDRLKKLDTKSDYTTNAIKIGDKAIVVKCGNGETISNKDRFMTASIDSLAKSLVGSLGSNPSRTTKTAMNKKAVIGSLASGLFHGATNLMPSISNAISKTPIAKNIIPGFASHFRSPTRNLAMNQAFKQAPKHIDDVAALRGTASKPLTSEDVVNKFTTGINNDAKLQGVTGLSEASGALAGQGRNGWWRLGVQGRGDLSNFMNQMKAQGHGNTEAYKALQSRYNSIGRNRMGLAIAAPMAYVGGQAVAGREPAKRNDIWSQIASVPAGAADMVGAGGIVKLMRENPEVTTLGSGAALAAMLYYMMSRGGNNTNNRYM
jgi:hypothetical protein